MWFRRLNADATAPSELTLLRSFNILNKIICVYRAAAHMLHPVIINTAVNMLHTVCLRAGGLFTVRQNDFLMFLLQQK